MLVAMKYLLFTCFLLLFCLAFACPDENEIICKTVCIHDGDETGFIINNRCICGNERDIKKIVARVPKYGKQIETKRYYDQ